MYKKSYTHHEKRFREWLKSPDLAAGPGLFAALQLPSLVERMAHGDKSACHCYDKSCWPYFTEEETKQRYEIERAVKDSGRLDITYQLVGQKIQVTLAFQEKHSHIEFFRIDATFHKDQGSPASISIKGDLWSTLRHRKIKKGHETYVIGEQEGKIVSVQCEDRVVKVGETIKVHNGNDSHRIVEILEPWKGKNTGHILKVEGGWLYQVPDAKVQVQVS